MCCIGAVTVVGGWWFIGHSDEVPGAADSTDSEECHRSPETSDGREPAPDGRGLRINEVGSRFDAETGTVSYGTVIRNLSEWTAQDVRVEVTVVDQFCHSLDDAIVFRAPTKTGTDVLPSRGIQVVPALDDQEEIGFGDQVFLTDEAREQVTDASVMVRIVGNEWADPVDPLPVSVDRWVTDEAFNWSSGAGHLELTMIPGPAMTDYAGASLVFRDKFWSPVGGTPLLRLLDDQGEPAEIVPDEANLLSITVPAPPGIADLGSEYTRSYVAAGYLDPVTGKTVTFGGTDE